MSWRHVGLALDAVNEAGQMATAGFVPPLITREVACHPEHPRHETCGPFGVATLGFAELGLPERIDTVHGDIVGVAGAELVVELLEGRQRAVDGR